MAMLTQLLPPDLAVWVRQHVLHPASPFQECRRLAAEQAEHALTALQPLADWALQRVLDNKGASGALVLLGLLAAMVVVAVWVQRFIMYCTRLVLRAVFWALVALVAAWIWNRGVAESARDFVDLVGAVVEHLTVLKDVWQVYYARYKGQENSYRNSARGFGR